MQRTRELSAGRANALRNTILPTCVAVAALLLVATIGFAAPEETTGSEAVSWEALLAPYSAGAPLPGGCRIDSVYRGFENDVVVSVQRPDGSAAVEVHVVGRGQWANVHESKSFGIGYETARSPAPERDAITRILAETIRSHDHGLPSPGAVPLGPSFEPSFLSWWLHDEDLVTRGIQVAWGLLLLVSPLLCWRAGRASSIGGGRLVAVVSACAVVALAATWHRGDEPLHANGHAWREAREVLAPWGMRKGGSAPFLHGRGGIALQWLLAAAERAVTGTANPFRISRFAGAAAAGATAFLVAILVRSPWAGLAAGCALASMPLQRALAVSGSALAIPAAILPWSLGLLLAAGLFRDRLLLAGASLAAALGTVSHTAMLAWPPALLAAWLVVARRRFRGSAFAVGALLLIAAAWIAQMSNVYEMVASRSQESGVNFLAQAYNGLLQRNLMLDPQWVSPLLLPLTLLWVIGVLRRDRLIPVSASVLPSLLVAAPFFAVTTCSSDAVRYQGAILPLVTSMALAGLWDTPNVARLGHTSVALVRAALLVVLVSLPLASQPPSTDPTAIEHRLVAEAAGRMQPRTLVVLPQRRFGHVIVDFPDFLLPRNSSVAFEGDPAIEAHEGPQIRYLGLACLSWDDATEAPSTMRPECRALLEDSRPWMVRSLRREDLPRRRDGSMWTFHRLATGVPFGFFAPS